MECTRKNNVVCNLCSATSIERSNFNKEEQSIRINMMKYVIPEINLEQNNYLNMCQDCIQNLLEAYNFKTICLTSIGSLQKPELVLDVDLNDTLSDKNLCDTKIKEELEYCLFCQDSSKNEFASGDALEELKVICKKCFPEMVLNNIEQAEIVTICGRCSNSLTSLNVFINKCLNVDQKIEQDYENRTKMIPDVISVKSNVKMEEPYDDATKENDDGINDKNISLQTNIKLENCSENLMVEESSYENLHLKNEEKENSSPKEEKLWEEKIGTPNTDIYIFKCQRCSFQTTHKKFLRHHQRNNHSRFKKTYKCKTCPYTTKYEKYLSKHTQCKVYKCNFCPFRANAESQLTEHLRQHKKGLPVVVYRCEKCPFRTSLQNNYKSHLLSHEERKLLKCSQCSFVSYKGDNLRKHLFTHKSLSEIKTYKCDLCPYVGKKKYMLRGHMLTHKSTSEVTMHSCTLCTFSSKHKSALIRHQKLHERKELEKTYACQECSFLTTRKPSFTVHMQSHRDDVVVENFHCDSCDYVGKSKKTLTRHIRDYHKTLAKKDMLKCDRCEYATCHKAYLKKHSLLHQKTSEVVMFQCEFCDKQSRYKRTIQLHVEKMHSDSQGSAPTYNCDKCEYVGMKQRSLERHILETHAEEAEKVFKCDVCPYETHRHLYLRRHSFVHQTETEIFRCKICPFESKYIGSWRAHQKRHKATAAAGNE